MPPILDLGFRQAAQLRAAAGRGPRRSGSVFHAAPPVRRPSPGPALVLSGLLHLAAVLLVLTRSRKVEPEPSRLEGEAPVRQVEMVYLAPRARPARERAQPPKAEIRDTRPPATITRAETSPPMAKSATPPLGSSEDALRQRSSMSSPTEPPAADRLNRSSVRASAPDRPGAAPPTMEAEAQRLFGPKPPPLDPRSGPERGFAQVKGNDALASNCRPRPHRPRAPGEPPDTGLITGRILRRDNGYPLAGALLQMIGTPYVAYTNERGWYTFRFDASLVEDCRTQLVRVWAPGYRTEWLSVVVDPQIRNSDVLLEPGR